MNHNDEYHARAEILDMLRSGKKEADVWVEIITKFMNRYPCDFMDLKNEVKKDIAGATRYWSDREAAESDGCMAGYIDIAVDGDAECAKRILTYCEILKIYVEDVITPVS